MVELETQQCTCDAFCEACDDQWWDQQKIIYDELRCHLFEWPPVAHPDEPIPHYVAKDGDFAIKVFRDTQRRYCALAQAAGIEIECDLTNAP